MLEVVQIPCLSDNYGFLVHDPASGQTISIDSPDADAITRMLETKGWSLTAIWNTHHHFDHAGGNAALVARWNCQVIAPKGDAKYIQNADRWVEDGDEVFVGTIKARVLHTPGHTMGHVIYVFDQQRKAFVGDTLFALGCGRLFEGDASNMWPSLQKIRDLSPQTLIYCAHEYTADNLRFALSVDPENQQLLERGAAIRQAREKDQPTVPFLLETDLQTNPFLRPDAPAIRAKLEMQGASDVEVFAEIRRRKDGF
ncbi:MAG: hydroxyacylglutathione hydrolase [Robiginitomaculum sp.]|nr:MAG: hydroxyacylglutathione hydrolase [Robiginitomaculum sp.]